MPMVTMKKFFESNDNTIITAAIKVSAKLIMPIINSENIMKSVFIIESEVINLNPSLLTTKKNCAKSPLGITFQKRKDTCPIANDITSKTQSPHVILTARSLIIENIIIIKVITMKNSIIKDTFVVGLLSHFMINCQR